MFVGFTKAGRLRAAGILAVLYLFCAIMPAAAFVFGDAAQAVNCLTDDHAAMAGTSTGNPAGHDHASHQHAMNPHAMHDDGIPSQSMAAHDHAGMATMAAMNDAANATPDQPAMPGHHGKAGGSCCGVICLSGLPATAAILSVPAAAFETFALTRGERFTGQAPALLYRPPISSVSL